jgi:hypothetical protein
MEQHALINVHNCLNAQIYLVGIDRHASLVQHGIYYGLKAREHRLTCPHSRAMYHKTFTAVIYGFP